MFLIFSPRPSSYNPLRYSLYHCKAMYKCKKTYYMEPYKQDKKKYFCLLQELIINKQEAECETSFEDKFNDLKKDIINELRKIQNLNSHY